MHISLGCAGSWDQTSSAFKQLFESHQSWVADYDCSDKDHSGSTVAPYGVLTLCRKSFKPEFKFYPFPTRMARKLLVTRIAVTGDEFLVGNVHLESLDSRALREQQLGICGTVLNSAPHSILCGDFNFCSYRNYMNINPLDWSKRSRASVTRSTLFGTL